MESNQVLEGLAIMQEINFWVDHLAYLKRKYPEKLKRKPIPYEDDELEDDDENPVTFVDEAGDPAVPLEFQPINMGVKFSKPTSITLPDGLKFYPQIYGIVVDKNEYISLVEQKIRDLRQQLADL